MVYSYCQPPHCGVSEVLGECRPFTEVIGGEFYAETEPYIVIYFKNFPNPSMSDPEFFISNFQIIIT